MPMLVLLIVSETCFQQLYLQLQLYEKGEESVSQVWATGIRLTITRINERKSIEEAFIAAASMRFAHSTRPKTAREIRAIMDALDFSNVVTHFEQDADEIDPYVVCDEVSVAAFNKYIGDGEGLRIGLRFLDLSDDGRILIVDFPTAVHEATVRRFENKFLTATGNADMINPAGSLTAHQAGLPDREPDASFGPLGTTPNRTSPPPPRTIADWVTLAVEVGRSQTWASLERAAEWWCGYAGIQYILLLKLSASGTQLSYRVYEIDTPQVFPTQPSAAGTVQRHNLLTM